MLCLLVQMQKGVDKHTLEGATAYLFTDKDWERL